MNERLERILKAIEAFAKAEDDELKELLSEFPEADKLVEYVDEYEAEIAKMLKDEKAYFIQAIQQYLASGSTDQILVQAILTMVESDMFDGDDFASKMTDASKVFLTKTCQELTSDIMDAIDKDVPFQVLSGRTTKWIDSWSSDLGTLMKLTSHKGVQRALDEGIQKGSSIAQIVLDMQDLPEFTRRRARNTAITEVLTACSVSQQEAYSQSPAVTGKTWLHSGGSKNKERPHHVALSGTTVSKEDMFTINAPRGTYTCMYPRDIRLPAGERVRCHCVLSPSVDEGILGLTAQEKELIRAQVIASLEE